MIENLQNHFIFGFWTLFLGGILPLKKLLSYIRRKNKPTDVEKNNDIVPSFSSLVKARLEFKKLSLGSGSNMRGQQIRVPGNTALLESR